MGENILTKEHSKYSEMSMMLYTLNGEKSYIFVLLYSDAAKKRLNKNINIKFLSAYFPIMSIALISFSLLLEKSICNLLLIKKSIIVKLIKTDLMRNCIIRI